MVAETLSDRMKEYYENAYRFKLPRRFDVIMRIDGKAFHTFTKGCKKPFDHDIITSMLKATTKTADAIQGFKLAYVQSDEASFWFNDKNSLETDAWFDNNIQKIVSITASTFTAHFNSAYKTQEDKLAMFDARVFIIPENEVSNYFLWRAKDWERNSIQMYCQSFFSHKEMEGQGAADQHEMLHKIGKNWATDLTELYKNGAFITKDKLIDTIKPKYDEINNVVQSLIIKS